MNAHTTPSYLIPRLRELAADILAGDTQPFGYCSRKYTAADWIDAAEQALDPIEQDFADLRAMAEYEDADWLFAASPSVPHDQREDARWAA